MLIQRASDKAAAVRAKAVANLASVIELWCGQKAGPLHASLGEFRQVSAVQPPDWVVHIQSPCLSMMQQ